jgi:glutathione S-transferase
MRGADHYVTASVPRWQRIAFKAVRPLAIRMLERRLNITPETAEHSRAKIDEQFAVISERLATRRYLVGERFTIADLTFAALAAPALLPPKYPVPLPPLDMFSSAACTQIFTWRDTLAGRFALRLYAEER